MAAAIGLAVSDDIGAAVADMLAAGVSEKIVRKWASKQLGRKAMANATAKFNHVH